MALLARPVVFAFNDLFMLGVLSPNFMAVSSIFDFSYTTLFSNESIQIPFTNIRSIEVCCSIDFIMNSIGNSTTAISCT